MESAIDVTKTFHVRSLYFPLHRMTDDREKVYVRFVSANLIIVMVLHGCRYGDDV